VVLGLREEVVNPDEKVQEPAGKKKKNSEIKRPGRAMFGGEEARLVQPQRRTNVWLLFKRSKQSKAENTPKNAEKKDGIIKKKDGVGVDAPEGWVKRKKNNKKKIEKDRAPEISNSRKCQRSLGRLPSSKGDAVSGR